MNWRTTILAILGAAALWLLATASAPAEIAQTNLRLWLDAGDHNADGVQELGAGVVWSNKVGAAHNATLRQCSKGPMPTWAGNGTPASPYAVQFRLISDSCGGYAVIDDSVGGTDLDTSEFTYELWARRGGIGGHGAELVGALISHCDSQGGGIGGIYYAHNRLAAIAAGALFDQGGDPAAASPFPQSAGAFTTTQFQHIVFTRAGDGDVDSAYYLNGVLQGRFKTESSNAHTDASPLSICGRLDAPTGLPTYLLDCDVAAARVYTAALSEAEVARNFSAEAPRFGVPIFGRTTE